MTIGKPVNKLPEEVSLSINGSASELYKILAATAGTSEHRLRITKGSDGSFVPNSKDLQVEKTGLREQSTVYVKDLGMLLYTVTVPLRHLCHLCLFSTSLSLLLNPR